MQPAVAAVDLRKHFQRRQVGKSPLARWFVRGGKRRGTGTAAGGAGAYEAAGGAGGSETAAGGEGTNQPGAHGVGTGGPGVNRAGAEAARDNYIVAVDGVSFEVQPGEIFGFLGPNGAGKTTTIRMLATLLEPSSGQAFICGCDVTRQATEARKRLGAVLAGDRSLYWKLSGRENLEFFATLYHVPRHQIKRRVDAVLERMQLTDRADELVERYSTGMKQRLSLARALLADPPVLLLDEPTLGLDPQSARNLRELVLELKREGRAILLTTHYMEEADLLSDRIAIIDHGRIIALDTPEGLKSRLAGDRIFRLEVAGLNGSVQQLAAGVPGLNVLEQRHDEEAGTTHLTFTLAQGQEGTAALWQAVAAGGLSVLNYTVKEPTLEDVFIALTGRGLRD